jgi:hypothetical protein
MQPAGNPLVEKEEIKLYRQNVKKHEAQYDQTVKEFYAHHIKYRDTECK